MIEPQFISESPTFDVIPGKLGECYLLHELHILIYTFVLFLRLNIHQNKITHLYNVTYIDSKAFHFQVVDHE